MPTPPTPATSQGFPSLEYQPTPNRYLAKRTPLLSDPLMREKTNDVAAWLAGLGIGCDFMAGGGPISVNPTTASKIRVVGRRHRAKPGEWIVVNDTDKSEERKVVIMTNEAFSLLMESYDAEDDVKDSATDR